MNEKTRVSKELNEKHRKILDGLLKLPENRECAECQSRGPRWASINLGIFICMQCSGVHRSLGVHVSKVRSATLDTWLPDQVAYMQTMGNNKSNQYWEAELPPKYDRVGIENFIRAKYVEKRWVSQDRKLEPHSSTTREEHVPVYKPMPTIRTSTRVIICLPEQNQSPQLYNLNKVTPPPPKVLEQKVIVQPKETELKSKAEEHKVVEIVSDQKVNDYNATDLFDLPQAKTQTCGPMLPLAEDNNAKKLSNKVQATPKSEFEDLFDGLSWVAPSITLTQDPCEQAKPHIMHLSEKSTMVHLSPVQQQQLAVHNQQQSKLTGNHQIGLNGLHRPIRNPGFYTSSSIKSRPSKVAVAIPTQLGGEYDFSSLTHGLFSKR